MIFIDFLLQKKSKIFQVCIKIKLVSLIPARKSGNEYLLFLKDQMKT